MIAAMGAWLVEPATCAEAPGQPLAIQPRPVVTVFGVGRRCGTTVVARALAAALAARDPAQVAAVSTGGAAARPGLATRPAAHLSALLGDVPGATTRPVGRLALVAGAEPLPLADTARHHAPLVLDGGSVAVGGALAAVADAVVLVAGPSAEPALAALLAAGIARVAPSPLIVLNRATADASGRWGDRAALKLPVGYLGARLALAGRDPHGALGEAIERLADACTAPA